MVRLSLHDCSPDERTLSARGSESEDFKTEWVNKNSTEIHEFEIYFTYKMSVVLN